jgi:hypothetical protein
MTRRVSDDAGAFQNFAVFLFGIGDAPLANFASPNTRECGL